MFLLIFPHYHFLLYNVCSSLLAFKPLGARSLSHSITVSKPPESWWLPSLSPHSWATLTWTVHLTWAKLNARFPVSKSSVVPLFLISVTGTTVYSGGQTKSLWKQKSGHATAKPSMGFLSVLEKKEKKPRLSPRLRDVIHHHLPSCWLHSTHTGLLVLQTPVLPIPQGLCTCSVCLKYSTPEISI